MPILDQLFGIQPQQDTGGLVQGILSQRFQPTPQDVNEATTQSVIGRMPTPYDTMQQRVAPGVDIASKLAQIQQQGEQTRALQMQNQMTQFQMPFIQGQMQDLYGSVNAPSTGGAAPDSNAVPSGGLTPPGAAPASSTQTDMANDQRLKKANLAAMMGNKELYDFYMKSYLNDPTVQATQEAAKTTATETSKQNVEDKTQARGTQDIIGLYGKLKTEANQAPSGVAENLLASATNAAGRPNAAAIAKGGYEADLNNLYLGMIRSLKGTGRVMQSELDELKNAQPKPTDSMQVKQSKIDAHMQYYTKRMQELGYDPATGKALGNNQLAPQGGANAPPTPSPQQAGAPRAGWSQDEWDALTPQEKASFQ